MEEKEDIKTREKESDEKEEKVEEVSLEKYNVKSWFKSAFTGLLLGLAVILPGISGSTIAILFKLYDKLLFAVSNIIKKFKKSIIFLLPIAIGAIIGFVVGFFVVQSVIEDYTFIVVCIFGGLMLGAAPEIYQVIKKEKVTPLRISLLLIGLAFPVCLSAIFANIPELDISSTFEVFPWWIHVVALLIGAVISLTQIIPGLSATVLLMSIGFFKPMMGAVHLDVLLNEPEWILFFFLFVVGFILGFYLSEHPVQTLRKKYPKCIPISQLQEKMDYVQVIGRVASFRTHKTKRQDMMCFMNIEDECGKIDVAVMPSLYDQNKLKIERNQIVIVQGKKDRDMSILARRLEWVDSDN